ncbi:hypothetical protein R3P38DRAFT_2814873 [Favolaschia claudopus]|uniref:Uncharacterized protein n=1 Tax=Favolaschia claudopus TaxID=2862362 RepID=A0AAV9Z273_9AGAR
MRTIVVSLFAFQVHHANPEYYAELDSVLASFPSHITVELELEFDDDDADDDDDSLGSVLKHQFDSFPQLRGRTSCIELKKRLLLGGGRLLMNYDSGTPLPAPVMQPAIFALSILIIFQREEGGNLKTPPPNDICATTALRWIEEDQF